MPAASLFANAAGGNLLCFSSRLSLVAVQPSARVTCAQAGSFPTREMGPLQHFFPRGEVESLKPASQPLLSTGPSLAWGSQPLLSTGPNLVWGVTEKSLHVSVGGLQDLPTLSKCLCSCSQPALSKMEAPGLGDVPRTMLYQGTARDSDPIHTHPY